MDPFSITAGCVGILAAVGETSISIINFIRDVRDAREDLLATSRQLAELSITINLIRDDHTTDGGNVTKFIPASINAQTTTVIKSCHEVLDEIDALLDKYRRRRLPTSWTWASTGKKEIAGLNKQLDAHMRTLVMVIELSTTIVAKSIKVDTAALGLASEQIKDDTAHIRQETGQILSGIDRLKNRLSPGSPFDQLPEHVQGRLEIITRYLESLTDYAESSVAPSGHSDENRQLKTQMDLGGSNMTSQIFPGSEPPSSLPSGQRRKPASSVSRID
ncbi:hypothetical protein B0H63DRAFT_139861 [Podospora didyma]|uniref:Fungal N-terminal domain-containing protein n=1 Tax=Podospora didyma TaxID=330526 RepID=A0AAE0NS41_9PEZI|nr:hypothetical protein B0H63DRAFT_139861 [Podospora didyma]